MAAHSSMGVGTPGWHSLGLEMVLLGLRGSEDVPRPLAIMPLKEAMSCEGLVWPEVADLPMLLVTEPWRDSCGLRPAHTPPHVL